MESKVIRKTKKIDLLMSFCETKPYHKIGDIKEYNDKNLEYKIDSLTREWMPPISIYDLRF